MALFANTLQRGLTTGFCIVFWGALSGLCAQGPQGENAHFDLASRLFKDALYANAAREFKQFIINFPTSERLPDAMLRLGQAHAKAEQYDQAREAFQQFIDRNPNHIEVGNAMRARADALSQLAEYTRAGEAYRAVHAAYPASEYAAQDLLSAGVNYHKGRALSKADAAFRQLIAQYPKSPLIHEAIFNLGRALLDASRPEEALAQFRTLVESAAPPARKTDALLEMGNIALARADRLEAERVFANLRRQYPKTPAAENSHLILAAWYAGKNDWARAEATYDNALLHLPRNTRRQQAVLGSANAKRKLGKSREALNRYADFLRAYPNSPFYAYALLGYGRAFADVKNYRNALDAFKKLQEKFPDADASIQAYGDIGNIWRALGTHQKALSAYRTYETRIQSPREKAAARRHIAQLCEDLHWYDLAAENYRTLINGTLTHYTAEGQFGLAGVFEKTGKTAQALREYRTYLKNYADSPRAEAAERRIQLLTEFGTETDRDRVWIDLLANLPAIAGDRHAQFALGKTLYRQKYYTRAITYFEAALAGEDTLTSTSNDTPTWAYEAYYLLGDSYMKRARRAEIENKSPDAWRDKGLTAFKMLIEKFPHSDFADDAALATIDAETADLQPDTLRAQTRLSAYREFENTYPNSDRQTDLRLRIADAHFSNTDIETALGMYLQVQKEAGNPTAKEHATYRIGVCQAVQQHRAQAEDTLRNFLFDYPQSSLAPNAQFQLGRILLNRGFYASAAEAFSELLTASPSLALRRSVRSLLAESFHRLGNYPRAIEIDESLSNRNPTPALLRRLAQSYFHNNQPHKAIATYRLFLRKFPHAPGADSMAFTRAEHLIFLNRTSEALAALREFSQHYPDSPLRAQADQSVGDLLFQTKKYAEALAAYRRIPKTERNEALAAREVLSLYRLKRITEADKATDEFKKTHKMAIEWLARFEVEKGKYQLAIKNPKKARQIFEQIIKKYAHTEAEVDAHYYIILAHRDEGPDKDGNNDPYLKALSAFVKNYPDSPHWARANLEFAEFWERNEEYNLSARAYRNALEKGVAQSEKPELLHKIAKNYAHLQAYDLAINFARQLIREHPQHPLALEARIDIGTIYLPNKGDHQQAILELRPLLKVATREHEKANIQYAIAERYFALGDYANAQREFLILRYDPKASGLWIASAQMKIAECYAEQGQLEQAIQELEEIKRRYGASSNYGLGAEKRIRQLKSRSSQK